MSDIFNSSNTYSAVLALSQKEGLSEISTPSGAAVHLPTPARPNSSHGIEHTDRRSAYSGKRRRDDRSLRSRLQAATNEQHQQLEALVRSHGLRTRSNYISLLRALVDIYESLEPQVARLSRGLGARLYPEARRKMPLLREDLCALGAPDSAAGAGLPQSGELKLDQPAEVYGVLYVVEGSTLGGQYVVAMLHQTLGITPESGCAFFHSYGARVGPMWKQFLQELKSFERSATTEELELAIVGARKTFGAFYREISGSVHDD